MRIVNYDALAASTPLNRDAAIARDGRGTHYCVQPPANRVHSDLPLALREIGPEMLACGFVDLRGIKFGRMTVVGLSADIAKRWVVRCACGQYEVRKSATIKALDRTAAQGMCFVCEHGEKLKAEAKEIAAGRGKETTWAKELKRRRGDAVTAILEAALALADVSKQFDGDLGRCPSHSAALLRACADYRAAKSPSALHQVRETVE